MKKIFAIAAAALLTVTALAQDGRSIYNKYSEENGVTAVYISPAMFRLVGKLPELEIRDNVDISGIVKTLNGFFLINSENTSINDRIRKDAEKFVTSGKYEILMEVKDDGEVMHMYTAGTEKEIESFVLISYEHDECTFICLDGKIPREEFEKMVAITAEEVIS